MTPQSEINMIFGDSGGVLLTNDWDKDQRARVPGRQVSADSRILNPGCFDILATLAYRSAIDISGFAPEQAL